MWGITESEFDGISEVYAQLVEAKIVEQWNAEEKTNITSAKVTYVAVSESSTSVTVQLFATVRDENGVQFLLAQEPLLRALNALLVNLTALTSGITAEAAVAAPSSSSGQSSESGSSGALMGAIIGGACAVLLLLVVGVYGYRIRNRERQTRVILNQLLPVDNPQQLAVDSMDYMVTSSFSTNTAGGRYEYAYDVEAYGEVINNPVFGDSLQHESSENAASDCYADLNEGGSHVQRQLSMHL
jgi:hypothetical protein